MARFRNRVTGVVVSRRDDAPALPAVNYEAVGDEKKAAPKRTATKKQD